MVISAFERTDVVADERYVGKVPAYRCKSCAASFVDPETEYDYKATLALVSKGDAPERDNVFHIRRESSEPRRGFWSTWFGRHGAANDVVRTTGRGSAR